MAEYFNPKALADLIIMEEEGEPGLLAALINDYISTFPNLLEDIKNGVDSKDYIATQNASHSLKSSSRLMGLEIIGELCQKIEEASSKQVEAFGLYAELDRQGDPSLKALIEFLKSRS